MPGPSRSPVVPLGKGLLHPLHYIRQFQPVFRPDIKPEQITLKTQSPNLEGKPDFRLMEHPAKNRPGLFSPEQWFPVVDAGADFVPHTLLE
jgi:hypothetical protein